VVTGVRFTLDNALVKIHGMELPLGNILDVSSGSVSSPSGQSLTAGTAVALLGKTVRVRQNEISYTQAENAAVGIKVNAEAGSTVRISICDENGAEVQTMSDTADMNGVAFFSWNGSMASGGYAPTGKYTVKIAGEEGDPTLYSFIEGAVEGISNLQGNAQIRIAGVNFNLSDIVDISEGNGSSLA
jgi:flagellar hook assembly protein FlgD